jgi:hypothetical protein
MAGPAVEFRILDQHRVPALDPKRKGQDDLVVTYSVNGTRGYLIRLPAENANEQSVVAAIRQELQRRGSLVGRTYQL